MSYQRLIYPFKENSAPLKVTSQAYFRAERPRHHLYLLTNKYEYIMLVLLSGGAMPAVLNRELGADI